MDIGRGRKPLTMRLTKASESSLGRSSVETLNGDGDRDRGTPGPHGQPESIDTSHSESTWLATLSGPKQVKSTPETTGPPSFLPSKANSARRATKCQPSLTTGSPGVPADWLVLCSEWVLLLRQAVRIMLCDRLPWRQHPGSSTAPSLPA